MNLNCCFLTIPTISTEVCHNAAKMWRANVVKLWYLVALACHICVPHLSSATLWHTSVDMVGMVKKRQFWYHSSFDAFHQAKAIGIGIKAVRPILTKLRTEIFSNFRNLSRYNSRLTRVRQKKVTYSCSQLSERNRKHADCIDWVWVLD